MTTKVMTDDEFAELMESLGMAGGYQQPLRCPSVAFFPTATLNGDTAPRRRRNAGHGIARSERTEHSSQSNRQFRSLPSMRSHWRSMLASSHAHAVGLEVDVNVT
jgi:hypothetical protein